MINTAFLDFSNDLNNKTMPDEKEYSEQNSTEILSNLLDDKKHYYLTKWALPSNTPRPIREPTSKDLKNFNITALSLNPIIILRHYR